MANRRPAGQSGFTRWLVIALIIVLLDQVTKQAALLALLPAERMPVIGGFFDLTLVFNRGAAFSILASAGGWQRWFFVAIGSAATVFIVIMLWRHGSQRLFALALCLILGGAIGNVIDRVYRGEVVDFLLFYWRSWHVPAFNVADSAITIGAALLIIDELLRVRRSR
ncbi:MAG: signal peptidase II [Betaproteobacteria bacterium]